MTTGEKVDKEARKTLSWVGVITIISLLGGRLLAHLVSSLFDLSISELSMRLICQFVIAIVSAIIMKLVAFKKPA